MERGRYGSRGVTQWDTGSVTGKVGGIGEGKHREGGGVRIVGMIGKGMRRVPNPS